MAYGAGAAILSGDALLALATEVVLESASARTIDGIRLMNRCVAELITGQALDLEFEQRTDVSLEDCKRMADGKTSALLECASSLGALLCDAPADQVESLGRFGRELGLAFQLVDDALGIWGDSETTGKPVLNDLRSRKKTLPITAALESGVPGLDAMRGLLRADDGAVISEEQLETAARQLSDAGFRQWVFDEARAHLEAAEAYVRGLSATDVVKDDLVALARFCVSRWN
jgi:geranylgeranyl diphosphate synthase type I